MILYKSLRGKNDAEKSKGERRLEEVELEREREARVSKQAIESLSTSFSNITHRDHVALVCLKRVAIEICPGDH